MEMMNSQTNNEIATLTAKLEAAESEARRQMQHVAATLQKLEAAESEAVKYKLATKMNAACIRDQAARIEALSLDKLRLDWLEANNACTEDPGVWTVTRCDFTKEDRVERFWVGAKLREAIDKARPSSPIQEKGMSVYNRLPRLRSPRQHRRSNVAVVICCGLIFGVLMAMYI